MNRRAPLGAEEPVFSICTVCVTASPGNNNTSQAGNDSLESSMIGPVSTSISSVTNLRRGSAPDDCALSDSANNRNTSVEPTDASAGTVTCTTIFKVSVGASTRVVFSGRSAASTEPLPLTSSNIEIFCRPDALSLCGNSACAGSADTSSVDNGSEDTESVNTGSVCKSGASIGSSLPAKIR